MIILRYLFWNLRNISIFGGRDAQLDAIGPNRFENCLV